GMSSLAGQVVANEEGIRVRCTVLPMVRPGRTFRFKSESHVEPGDSPLVGYSNSLVGWRIYTDELCAEIRGFEAGEYTLVFLPAHGNNSVRMALPELVRYRARYNGRLIRAKAGRVYEINAIHEAA